MASSEITNPTARDIIRRLNEIGLKPPKAVTIALTNRCNLNCPICFANANAAGYLYEPTFEQVTAMLQSLRDLRPTPAPAVQFSGGEPTLHPRFHDIINQAARMGFSNIQIATNGLKMADYNFARRSRDAGLHTIYLQFDAVTDEVLRKMRGEGILETKLQTIENARKLNLRVVLTPTIVKGINDHQVGDIVRFAIANADVVTGVSFQPVCFTGRINETWVEITREGVYYGFCSELCGVNHSYMPIAIEAVSEARRAPGCAGSRRPTAWAISVISTRAVSPNRTPTTSMRVTHRGQASSRSSAAAAMPSMGRW